MTDLRLFLIGGMALAVTGCASSPPETAPVAASAAAAQPVAVEAPERGLPGQTLAIGECGLFLWTRREQPEFIFFSKAGTETGLIWLDNQSQALNRIAVGGDIFGQQLTEQDFQLAGGKTVELRMQPGDMLVGGQRIPEASLTVIDAEGWRTLIPVAGVTACQTEQ